MGQVESAHGPLRRIYSMISDYHPSLHANLWLHFSFKSLKDITIKKGLVPSLLAFGRISLFGDTGSILRDQNERLKEMYEARSEAKDLRRAAYTTSTAFQRLSVSKISAAHGTERDSLKRKEEEVYRQFKNCRYISRKKFG